MSAFDAGEEYAMENYPNSTMLEHYQDFKAGRGMWSGLGQGFFMVVACIVVQACCAGCHLEPGVSISLNPQPATLPPSHRR